MAVSRYLSATFRRRSGGLAATLAVALFLFPAVVWADNTVTKDRIVFDKGKYIPLCEGIKQIIQLPENTGIITSKYVKSEDRPRRIVFPELSKDFQQPVWEDVNEEEVRANAPHSYRQIKEAKKPYALKKITLQFTDNIQKETFYFVDFGMDKANYVFAGPNTAIFMPENSSSLVNRMFNQGAYGWSIPFYFRGKTYFEAALSPNIIIYEPSIISTGELWMKDVCAFVAKPQLRS